MNRNYSLLSSEINNDIEIDQLMNFVKAPDFPTGGKIYGYEGVKDAFHTGRGRIVVRS
jgi:DNA gyrase subunit A